MPLLWLALAFLCGILLSSMLGLAWWAWSIIASACLGLFLLTHKPTTQPATKPGWLQSPIPLGIMLVFLCLGAVRYQFALPKFSDPRFIAHYNNRGAISTIEGVIIKPADAGDSYTNLRVRVDQLQLSPGDTKLPVHGLLLVKAPSNINWLYGDRVRLVGELVTPPVYEEFSYRDYLARQGVHSYLPDAQITKLSEGQGNPIRAAIYKLQAKGLQVIYQIFPDPEASLLAGILLGVETGIPEHVQKAFIETGTAHIIVISGFNISILAALFITIFGRLLGRWKGALVATLAIAIYTVLVGANAPVVRAALMGGLSIYAGQLGRRQHGLNSLGVIAGVMALANPHLLWDVGFQLSFAATLGLVLFAEPFNQFFVKHTSRIISNETAQKLSIPFGEYFLFTIAAQLTTFPIILYHFNYLSLVSLLANPVILPFQPPVMILGGIAVIVGLSFLPLGQALAYLAYPFISFTIRAVELLSKFKGGMVYLGDLGLPLLLLFYTGLLLFSIGGERTKKLTQAIRPGLVVLLLGALSIYTWKVALAAPDGKLHLVMLDVSSDSSSGEALLIQSPTGRFVLIGGGPSSTRLSDFLGRWLPLNQRSLDWLVVAGSKERQLAGLPRNIQRFPPLNVLWAIPEASTSSGRYLEQVLGEQAIKTTKAQVGHHLDLGEGAHLDILTLDDYGASALLEWHNFRALLPLGLDTTSLQALQADPNLASITIYMLADSGRDWLNPPESLSKLNPQLILLSVAAADWNGFPPEATLRALEGYPLLRTDLNGWIHVSTDGQRMWVEAQK